MYFPQNPIEIKKFLQMIDSYPDEPMLWIIEPFLMQLIIIPIIS